MAGGHSFSTLFIFSLKKFTNSELVDFLKKQSIETGIVNKLKFWYRPFIFPADYLLKLIPSGAKVLDIGFGLGQFLLLVAKFTEASKIAGIEIKEDFVRVANDIFQKSSISIPHELYVSKGNEMHQIIQNYDLVFLIDVLHHIPKSDQTNFLLSLYNSMAPGKKLILKDIDGGSPFVFFNKIHDLIFAGKIGHEIKLRDLVARLERMSFRIISVKKKQMFVYPHFTLVVQK